MTTTQRNPRPRPYTVERVTDQGYVMIGGFGTELSAAKFCNGKAGRLRIVDKHGRENSYYINGRKVR